MTTEQEKAYEAWWSDPAAPATAGNLRYTFCAGWDAALASRPTVVEKSIQLGLDAARSDIRQEIMDMAIVAFRDGADETARLYRDLANELFNKV